MNLEEKLDALTSEVRECTRTIPYQSKLLQYFRISILSLGIIAGAAIGGCTVAAFGQQDASGRPMFRPKDTIAQPVQEEFPQCGKAWHKTYDRLTPEQKLWFKQVRVSEYAGGDISGDGLPDTVRLTSYPTMVGVEGGCHLGEKWYEKQNVLFYEPSSGQKKLYSWRGGLVEGFRIRTTNGVAVSFEAYGEGYTNTPRVNEKGSIEDALVKEPFTKTLEVDK